MKEVIRFYLQEAKVVKGKVAVLFLTEGFSGMTIALLPLFLALLVDKIVAGEAEFSEFLPLLLLIALVEIADRIMLLVYFYATERVTIRVEKNIAQKIFSHLTEKSLAFHSNNLSGNLVSNADKATRGFSQTIKVLIESLFSNFIFIVVVLISLATQAPVLFPVFFITAIVLVIIGWKMRKTEATPSLEESVSDSFVSAHLADTLSNIETVVASGEQEAELKFYNQHIHTWEKSAKTLMRKRMRNSGIIYSAPLFIILPLLFGGVFLVVNDHLSAGALVLLLLYGQRIISMANRVNIDLTGLIETLNKAKPMIDVLNEDIEISDGSDKDIVIDQGRIEFKNISFSYPGQNTLFEDFALVIDGGERIGFVGHSGAGKSTLARFILKTIQPDNGQILIDNQDVSNYKSSSLRQQMTYVGQEPILFHRTVAENIAYGSNASDKEIKEAARLAFADRFIEKLTEGYQSRVGDRGVKLSGGERQRIVLARAFLRDSPILLLDEPTSALDSYSEEFIQKSLEKLFQDKTAVVIAHRLSTIAHLDRIIVLDQGRIIEEGSHKELLGKKGLYYSLWQKQSEGFLPED